MEHIHELERAGFVARIYHDQDASSPADWCNVGTLAYSYRGAGVGTMPNYWQDFSLEQCIPDSMLALPVYAYDDRNGTVLQVADSWEQANGLIYADSTCACGCGSAHDMDLEQLRAALEAELTAWQQWAQGDVYGVVVTNPAGEEVDSCWGFYGQDYAEEEAARMIDEEPTVHLLEAHPGMSKLIVS